MPTQTPTPTQTPYSNGQTVIYTQPNYAQMEPEKIITDNVMPSTTYPFNLNTYDVSDIELKLENTTVTIENSEIISNKPLFIKYNGNVLYVWNTVYYPNKIIGSKGNTFTDGHNILDFDNTSIKSIYSFDNVKWIVKLKPIQNIVLNGTSNTVTINQLFNESVSLKIYGENNISIKNDSMHDNLKIYNTNSTIDFHNKMCKNLNLETKGNGIIKNLCVTDLANTSIIGPCVMNLHKLNKTKCEGSIYGTGKIIWINMD